MVAIIFFWLAVIMCVANGVVFLVAKGNIKSEAIAFNALLLLGSAVAKYLGL
jgi:archaellum biogenesis protein FlaJ (TadC family)